MTLVGRQGQIFLDDDYPAPLQVTLQDGSKCYLEFTPEGKPDPDRPYQDALAVPQASAREGGVVGRRSLGKTGPGRVRPASRAVSAGAPPPPGYHSGLIP